MARQPTVISLFSGAGGLDYGFEAAGFQTRVAVEHNKHCCRTLRANRTWRVIESDIHEVSAADVLKTARLSVGEADVLIGGPPCQPFSKAGYWATGDTRRLNDPRASTLDAYMRLVEGVRPRAFLLENVAGLAYRSKREGLDHLERAVRRINRRVGTRYRPHVAVLNAADYGVPQLRQRFFMVASREGADFEFPAPTHFPRDSEGVTSDTEYRTAWNALADVPAPDPHELAVRGKWAGLLPSIPEGSNYLWHTARGGGTCLFGWRTRYWSFLLKLAKDLPSWTVQAQPGPAIGPFHWDNRQLSMRELARVQTFPDDVVVEGSRLEIQRQLGNAVPSLLAETLARSIRVQLLGRRIPRKTRTLLPPNSATAPPPSRRRPVPREFLALAGNYPEHPGDGLGPRAQK